MSQQDAQALQCTTVQQDNANVAMDLPIVLFLVVFVMDKIRCLISGQGGVHAIYNLSCQLMVVNVVRITPVQLQTPLNVPAMLAIE